jgi:ribonucleoside-diphosphate reductase alpha chain
VIEYSDEKEYACCCLASISLGELVDVGKLEGHVKIYSKTSCPYCDKALELLPKDCEKIVLDDDNERKNFYNELNRPKCDGEVCYISHKKFNTVPQIFVGDYHIGGYTDLVKYLKPSINYGRLEEICEVLVRNLNKVIDINYYPVVETARSNFRHRPLGIGVQGFSDLLFKLGFSFESDDAKMVNKQLFEAIQYYCLKASCKIAKEREEVLMEYRGKSLELPMDRDVDLPLVELGGHRFTLNELKLERYRGAYLTFEGSPLSRGEFQWEKCGVTELFMGIEKWEELRRDIMKYGVRNSLLTALMPTASTSQILGNNECFEPITSNLYTRRTLAGDFVVLNKYLVRDLVRDGLWSRELKDMIVAENGSIANMTFFPDKMRELYKTVWEIKQKCLIDLSADRTPFICQTQSLNLFFEEPKVGTLGSALIYGWKRGLKTGCYYIRSRPKVQAQQFTVDPKLKEKLSNYEVCESCSG